eukprot:8271209-Alexandrium_andersonii.AAC.1
MASKKRTLQLQACPEVAEIILCATRLYWALSHIIDNCRTLPCAAREYATVIDNACMCPEGPGRALSG